ncbi:hypothetical protein E2C01_069125 [Portunus trituberculatus]|uniref:Uncharacterized protein n=1 Tax=Portunus trituberculatus TaxID=210409 RepID=A0A5B7HQM1_PORTR|nr:hypothetical protein [Portunus trituberculatus]
MQDGSGLASSHSTAPSSHKGSSSSRSGYSQRESSRSSRRYEDNRSHCAGKTGMPDRATTSLPSTSRADGHRDASPALPWNVVLDAIAELRRDMNN